MVGYIQHAHSAWDSDVDPITDAESHEEAGGGWTFHPGGSHGQVAVVLQLDSSGTASNGSDTDASGEAEGDEHDGDTADATDRATNETDGTGDGEANAEAGAEHEIDEQPGFGVLVTALALSLGVLARTRR